MATIVKSFSSLNAAVEFAKLDDELFRLLTDNNCNRILQEEILSEYFSETRNNLQTTGVTQTELFAVIEDKILVSNSEAYRTEMTELIKQDNEEEIFLRGSVFKREVPKIYNNSCCISGMKVDSILSVSMIDACHIVPFSATHDDTITNGIALCPNLHRAFDRGLISIDNDYKVVVSNSFIESPSDYGILKYKGQKIRLPDTPKYYPSLDNFEWHRNKTFKV